MQPTTAQPKSVLGIVEVAIHSYFAQIGPPSRPNPLKNKAIHAVGLGRLILNYPHHNNSFNRVGFGSAFLAARGSFASLRTGFARFFAPKRRRKKMKDLSRRRKGAKTNEAGVSCFLCDRAPLREALLLFPSFPHAF